VGMEGGDSRVFVPEFVCGCMVGCKGDWTSGCEYFGMWMRLVGVC